MAKTKASSSESYDEFRGGKDQAEAESAEDAGGLVQYRPGEERAGGAQTEASAQGAEGSIDTIAVSDDWFRARDDLIQRLAGASARAAAQTIDANEIVPKILGVGVGFKFTAGTLTGEVCLKVLVEEKLPESALTKAQTVPDNQDGLPTDVEAIGGVVPQSYAFRYNRPVRCGASVGHPSVTAGTIGCMVVRKRRRLCILSNNHVLANENDSRVGDLIIQPGRVDGGSRPGDVIGELDAFIPFERNGRNLVDAAVALTSFEFVQPRHMTYTLNPRPLFNPRLGTSVMKNGRTTQSTVGMITDIGINNLPVGYTRFGTAIFNNQMIIRGVGGVFSMGGDSGSLIVTVNTKQPVALLFAGTRDNTQTYANPIQAVMDALDIDEFLAARPPGN